MFKIYIGVLSCSKLNEMARINWNKLKVRFISKDLITHENNFVIPISLQPDDVNL